MHKLVKTYFHNDSKAQETETNIWMYFIVYYTDCMLNKNWVHLSTSLLQNYVLWLQVPMNYLIFMEILDTRTCVCKNIPCRLSINMWYLWLFLSKRKVYKTLPMSLSSERTSLSFRPQQFSGLFNTWNEDKNLVNNKVFDKKLFKLFLFYLPIWYLA